MGLGGSIGTALFLGIGRALAATGPLSMLLGFAITGAGVWAMVSRLEHDPILISNKLKLLQMLCLGEMATWLPVTGAMPVYASRYVDQALGFAIGWNVSTIDPIYMCSIKLILQGWYGYMITICIEISAAALVIGYWNTTINVSIDSCPSLRLELNA